MPTRGSALFAAGKRGQSNANAKERDVGALRGVGPRCEITEVRREREEMEDTGDRRRAKRGCEGSMGDGHEREQEQEHERQ